MITRTLAILGSAALLTGLAVAPASAASEKDGFVLDCSDGNAYAVTVNGNGEWTPARDSNSTRVFVPMSFGDFTFTAYAAGTDTVVASEGGGAPTTKPARMTGRTILTCDAEQWIYDIVDETISPDPIDVRFAVTVTVATSR